MTYKEFSRLQEIRRASSCFEEYGTIDSKLCLMYVSCKFMVAGRIVVSRYLLHLKFSLGKCSCASYEIMFGKNYCNRECQPR